MIGLLKKDFYLMYRTNVIWTLIMLCYPAIGVFTDNVFFLSFSMMMPVLLINSAIVSDEGCKWEPYALAMPVSRRDIVLSRYLFGVLNMALIIGIEIVMMLIGSLFGLASSDSLLFLPIVLAAGFIIISFQMPAMTKYGATKGRMMSMLIIILVMATTGALSALFSDIDVPVFMSTSSACSQIWIAPVLGLLVMAVSALCSIRIAEKRNY